MKWNIVLGHYAYTHIPYRSRSAYITHTGLKKENKYTRVPPSMNLWTDWLFTAQIQFTTLSMCTITFFFFFLQSLYTPWYRVNRIICFKLKLQKDTSEVAKTCPGFQPTLERRRKDEHVERASHATENLLIRFYPSWLCVFIYSPELIKKESVNGQ